MKLLITNSVLMLMLYGTVLLENNNPELIPNTGNNNTIDEVLNFLGDLVHYKKVIELFCQKNYFNNESHNIIDNIQEEYQKEEDYESEFEKCYQPSSCAELFYAGVKESGIYTIFPKPWMLHGKFEVYCDMETDGGGWTVFQNRDEFDEPHLSFLRNWEQYANGFGDLEKEFWLGNEYIHLLTTQNNVVMKVEMENFDGETKYALYDDFEVASGEESYRLRIGGYSGDAGDSLTFANGAKFVTYDFNDENLCSDMFKGGWWYKLCHKSNLNGIFLHGKHRTMGKGMNWKSWLGYFYSLKRTQMKIRPKEFKITEK